jgi:hypothetical protein
VRVDLALAVVAAEGISGTGEVGDSDPFSATMDAIADHRPDEIIISTKPVASSGWLRRDLIERVENASGVPVTHLVTDLDREELPIRTTLVIANRTSSGHELIDYLKAKATGSTGHVFIGVVPQQGGDGSHDAHERLAAMLASLHAEGLFAAGMVGDPDPYVAAVNSLALFRVDDLVISTLPDERSGWLRSQLIERVQRATTTPVEHVVVEHAATPTATG